MRSASLVPAPVTARLRPAGRWGAAFGPRFFLITLLGVLWALPAFWDRRFLLVMAGWDLCALLAFAADLLRLPDPGLLELQREWHGPPSLSNNVKVSLEMRNSSRAYVECSIIDDVHRSLRAEAPAVEIKVAGGAAVAASYQLRPLERGDIALGSAWVRYRSGARFAERWALADLAQTVRVFPDLEEARRHNIYLARARQIELEKRLIRQRGVGREFESLREYQPGDEFRSICWTATARRGKHVTKLFQVERSQAVWLVMDAGRLLRTRVGELSKLDLAVNAALSLAQIAVYSGDRVGVLVYGRGIQQRVSLGRGPFHMRAVLEALASACEEAAEADHLLAASALLQLQKQRSLIIWVTDLADTSMTPEVVESASRILSKHLLLFTVIAQLDLLEFASRYPKDATEMFEVIAAQELVQRREKLMGRVRNRGALALEVSPNRLTTALVNQYLRVKERNLI
ncbi:MAG TPA: DUF58 domain-containing protein [Candidatus Saccharimonadales bacterium]|jgi:uncharacterized protein (DUF58 family)|nr:DUF58 domain-containing protein [Candidatus Saccharimonadales bacterium]